MNEYDKIKAEIECSEDEKECIIIKQLKAKGFLVWENRRFNITRGDDKDYHFQTDDLEGFLKKLK